jgi:hypothetical protein
MNNIKGYKTFESDGYSEHAVEKLRDLIEYNKELIIKFFADRSMEADFVQISEPDEFVVEYWPIRFDATIPKKISYYIDDLCKILTDNLKVGVDWDFSPNGNVQRLIFSLDEEIPDEYHQNILKYIKTKDRLKY